MTKAAAIYQFWAQFGLDTYEENSVYQLSEKPSFPYLTYELMTDSFDGEAISLTASLWYRSTSWTAANKKADEISAAIGRGGMLGKCDGGLIHITRGSPFTQSMGDDTDDMIKRINLSISVEFWTEN